MMLIDFSTVSLQARAIDTTPVHHDVVLVSRNSLVVSTQLVGFLPAVALD